MQLDQQFNAIGDNALEDSDTAADIFINAPCSVVPRARHCGIPTILPSISLKNAPSAGLRARPRKFPF